MKRLAIFVLIFASPALAQQQQPTAAEQALGQKLFKEMQEGVNCSVNLISVQAELAKANARIKELETKPEAKKE